MAYVQTVNARARGPEILERLSELEQRGADTRGIFRSGYVEMDSSVSIETDTGDPRGYLVLNATGHEVGIVEDLYVDPNTREPYFALLSLGNHALGQGNRMVLVSFDDIIVISRNRLVRIRMAAS